MIDTIALGTPDRARRKARKHRGIRHVGCSRAPHPFEQEPPAESQLPWHALEEQPMNADRARYGAQASRHTPRRGFEDASSVRSKAPAESQLPWHALEEQPIDADRASYGAQAIAAYAAGVRGRLIRLIKKHLPSRSFLGTHSRSSRWTPIASCDARDRSRHTPRRCSWAPNTFDQEARAESQLPWRALAEQPMNADRGPYGARAVAAYAASGARGRLVRSLKSTCRAGASLGTHSKSSR